MSLKKGNLNVPQKGQIWTFLAVSDGVHASTFFIIIIIYAGFGHELAHHLDSLGVTVYAGCLYGNGKGAQSLRENCSENMHVLQLDVRKADQVKAAMDYIKEHLPSSGMQQNCLKVHNTVVP